MPHRQPTLKPRAQRATRNPIEQEKNIMAFVNEFVSEEDIKKYSLDDLKKEYDPWNWRDGRPPAFRHAWTIDRERDIYFMPVKMIEETGPSGRSEPTTRDICILNLGGRGIRLTINRVGSSTSFSDSPFHVEWNLLEIDTSSVPDIPKDTIVQVLKEALTAHGYRGVFRQVPNTIVEFKF